MELKGYTQMNNTLLWALMQLTKRQRLIFTCLRIESDYRTHLSDFLSIRDIVEFTGIIRPHVFNTLKELEKIGWITKTEKRGYKYQWELSIAKLTSAEAHAFIHHSVPETSDQESQPETVSVPEPHPQPEVPPVDRFQIEEIDGKPVKVLTLGAHKYRYNPNISDFETSKLWQGNDAPWETANGHAAYLSEADKIELQSHIP